MHRVLIPTVFLAGCAVNNAELTEGSYVAFVSDRTALSLTKGELDPADYDTTYNIDCREFATPADEDALRLDEPLRVCGAAIWPPAYEQWATQAGYRVVTEQLDPWRGEALITSEGDLRISFHHRVPGGADMRIVMAVDPDFAPTTCIQDEAGGNTRVPKDGDWIGEWSKELQWIAEQDEEYRKPYAHLEDFLADGRLFFMNAYSYQFNPFDTTGTDWDIPDYWVAGASNSKFVEELMFHRSARYGEPEVYNNIEATDSTEATGVAADDLWYCQMAEGADPYTAECEGGLYASMTELQDHVRGVSNDIRAELDRFFLPDKQGDPIFAYQPITHTNFWRIPDHRPPGFDGWAELHYNYIVFSGDSVLEEGGSARGAFSLVLDADISQTRLFVEGKFNIDKIKKDRWKTDDLQADKLIEHDVELCSAASEHDANPSGE